MLRLFLFRYEDRVYCLEAVGAGVRLILLSELLKRYPGGIDHYEVSGPDDEQRRRALSFAFTQLGKLYKVWS